MSDFKTKLESECSEMCGELCSKGEPNMPSRSKQPPTFAFGRFFFETITWRMNQLNLQTQVTGNVRKYLCIWRQTAVHAFPCEIDLWVGKMQDNNLIGFPTVRTFAGNKNQVNITAQVHHNISRDLKILKDKFYSCLPEYGQDQHETNSGRSQRL